MNLDHQVCSLDLAKRLKELGVKQESHFKWHILDPNFGVGKLKVKLYTEQEWNDYAEDNLPEDAHEEFYSAFTAAELGEMLPAEVDVRGRCMFISERNGIVSNWGVGYRREGNISFPLYEMSDTEADARALMLAYLIEHGIITANGEVPTKGDTHSSKRGLGEGR